MRQQCILPLSAALLCLTLFGPARAQTPVGPVQPPGAPPNNPAAQGGRNGPFAQIRQQFQQQRVQLRTQIERERDELGNLVQSNASPQQAHAKLLEIVKSEGQLEDLNLQEYYAIIPLLPPDKRQIYMQRMAEQVRRRHGVNPGAPGGVPRNNPPQQ